MVPACHHGARKMVPACHHGARKMVPAFAIMVLERAIEVGAFAKTGKHRVIHMALRHPLLDCHSLSLAGYARTLKLQLSQALLAMRGHLQLSTLLTVV